MALIDIQNIKFEYTTGNIVLENIEYSFEVGTINVILGLNGCGKTTLIKLIAGLLKPINGSITIDEKSIFY
jgi:ABC-type cobalamin/Fe3+-siderophores transport system ATPase subunit